MESFSQIEVYNSYLFLRTLLGITNDKKNDILRVGIRYTGNELLAINELSTRAVLLLKRNAFINTWSFAATYPELEPVAFHIKIAVTNSSNPHLSEPAFDALQKILTYRDQ